MIDGKKRIAFFLPNLGGGGAERVVLNLAEGIANEGYAVDLVLVRASGPYLAQVPNSVRVVNLNASRTIFSLLPLISYLRREYPFVMLSALAYVNIIALWARKIARVSTRIIVSEHSVPSLTCSQNSNRRDKLVLPLRRCYHWSDGIVAVSQGVRNDLAQMTGIPHDRISVIYNAVITKDLQNKKQAGTVHPWLESNQPHVILAVGRLAPEKNFQLLIHSFKQVRQKGFLARLIILGEGEERPALEGLIKQLDLEQDVDLPGFEENPYPYMARASLLVQSSLYEALPTVLIEALFCGMAIIATDCPGGTREILENGQYGLLVPPEDPDALAQAIAEFLAIKIVSLLPEASWMPFEMNTVVAQYLRVFLGQ